MTKPHRFALGLLLFVAATPISFASSLAMAECDAQEKDRAIEEVWSAIKSAYDADVSPRELLKEIREAWYEAAAVSHAQRINELVDLLKPETEIILE